MLYYITDDSKNSKTTSGLQIIDGMRKIIGNAIRRIFTT